MMREKEIYIVEKINCFKKKKTELLLNEKMRKMQKRMSYGENDKRKNYDLREKEKKII